MTHAVSTAKGVVVDTDASDAPKDDAAQVRVSLQSALQGHRFVLYLDGDPERPLTVGQEGVLVDQADVEQIQEAAARSGVTVKVDSQ
jgi:hypothetical protein